MNTPALRAVLKSRWSFLWRGWTHRKIILGLCDWFESLPAKEKELREEIERLNKALVGSNHALQMSGQELSLVHREFRESKEDLKKLREKYNSLLIRKEAPEERVARDALYLANLEIGELKKRLEEEQKFHGKTRQHVGKMWQFIAVRHRIGQPPANGTIRKILKDAEGKR